MLYLTCTTITSVDLAHYRVSRAKDLVSVDCGTSMMRLDCNKTVSVRLSFPISTYNNATQPFLVTRLF